MRVRISRKAMVATVTAASALTLGVTLTANAATTRIADTAPRTGDVVGVGSDTLQNAADFLLDQSGNGVAGGYNSLGNNNRVFDVYSTGDANGRATFDGTCGTAGTGSVPTICTSTNAGAPNVLAGTVILRGGQKPVARPNGSGAGVGALINDSVGGTGYQGLPAGSIQFARMSRLPNAGEEGNCPTSNTNCGGLHVYQFATDTLAVAHISSGYHGPSAGLTTAQLASIYECNTTTWSQIPGSQGTGTIHPLIPQSGSGTRNFFIADLTASDPAFALGSCVRTVQEHDPDGIYQDSSQADAIEPFSTGKLKLINAGYFSNGGAAFAPNLLTADTGSSAYNSSRGLYFVVRNADLTSTTPFQTGSAKNFVQTLFAGSTSVIARSSNASIIAAAGFTQQYIDCGVNPTTCSAS